MGLGGGAVYGGIVWYNFCHDAKKTTGICRKNTTCNAYYHGLGFGLGM